VGNDGPAGEGDPVGSAVQNLTGGDDTVLDTAGADTIHGGADADRCHADTGGAAEANCEFQGPQPVAPDHSAR
jgi:hypothetical protein